MKQKMKRAWDTDNGSMVWVESRKRFADDDFSAICRWE